MEQENPHAFENPFTEKYRYAATYGLYLGLYMAFFYLLGAFSPASGFVRVLCSIGNLGALFVAFHLIRRYRDEALDGYARFGWIWSFSFWLSIFAAFIMAAVHFVHYQWLQPDFIGNTFNQALNMLESMDYPEEQLNVVADLGTPSAIQMTFMFLWADIIGGAFLALLYALFLQRRDSFGDFAPRRREEPSHTCGDDLTGKEEDRQNEEDRQQEDKQK